jgi:glycosyltransferase involved in cell wall biosynthesis
MTVPPAVSVIVATRNRSASLRQLLVRLAGQRSAPPFEVIVVDNGSEDHTPRLLQVGIPGLVLRTVRVPQAGKGRALNAGLRLARGSLVVLTDDDVVPGDGWLAALHQASLEHPECNVFGGPIEVDRAMVPRWIRRSHNLMGLLTSEPLGPDASFVYGFGHYPFGPNLAFRRRLLGDGQALYPEDLGPGTGLAVGDESAFLIQLSPPGARDRRFVAGARVWHAVEGSQLSLAHALRRSFVQGRVQRRLGLPPGRLRADGSVPPWPQRVRERLRTCASLRELLCVCARQLGFVAGGTP